MIRKISTSQLFLNKTNNKDFQVQTKNKSLAFKENLNALELKTQIKAIFHKNKKDYPTLTEALNELQYQNNESKWLYIQIIAQELLKQDNLPQLTEHILRNFDEYVGIYAIKELCKDSRTEKNIETIINHNLNIIRDQDKPILKEILKSDQNIKKLAEIIKAYISTCPLPDKDFLEDELGENTSKLIILSLPIHKKLLETLRNAFNDLIGLNFYNQNFDHEKAKIDDTY